jgi:hypothetical protein
VDWLRFLTWLYNVVLHVGGRSQAKDFGVQGAEGDDGTADWRKLHTEELRDLYCQMLLRWMR